MLVSYDYHGDTISQYDVLAMRNAVRQYLKSHVEAQTNNTTFLRPFREVKVVTTTVAINYYLVFDDILDDECLVLDGLTDLIRWAWDCLQSASNDGNAETMLYLGLIIARALFSIRKHNPSGESIKQSNSETCLDSLIHLDPENLTTWLRNIISHLNHMKSRSLSNIFEEFQNPLPHLSVFAWVYWEYVNYYKRSTILPPTLLQSLLSTLNSFCNKAFLSDAQSDRLAVGLILNAIAMQCTYCKKSSNMSGQAKFSSAEESSSSQLRDSVPVTATPASQITYINAFWTVLETTIPFLEHDEIVTIFGVETDHIIESALKLVFNVICDMHTEFVNHFTQQIVTDCIALLSTYVERLSPDNSDDIVFNILSSILKCIYQIRKNNNDGWCKKLNELVGGFTSSYTSSSWFGNNYSSTPTSFTPSPTSSFFSDLASCLIPRSHRHPHQILINTAIKVAALVKSGSKLEERSFDLFLKSDLTSLLRCHAVLSQFDLNWLQDNTKDHLYSALTADDTNQNRYESICFQTQPSIEYIFQAVESTNDGVIGYKQYLSHHFSALGGEALSSTLDLILPFNQGIVSSKYLASFLHHVLSHPYIGRSIDMHEKQATALYPPEEMWIESQSTKSISSLPPDHPLSWRQAFMLLQYLGVTSECAKELLKTNPIQNANPTQDQLPTTVCQRLVSLAERKISFSTFLRPTFCEWLRKTQPGPDIPPWYGDDVSFILHWQQFATDRLGIDCNSLASAFVDAHLQTSIVLPWMLLPSCLLPYPDTAEVLFSINRIHRLACWSHENKRYWVQFDPGLDFPPFSNFFRANPSKQYWLCKKQHGMPESIKSSTLEELGNELRRLLNVEGEGAFEETNLLLESEERVAKFFVSAVMLRVDELISQLPGVENFYYQVEERKWCVEVKDLEAISTPRLDTSIMDVVKWTPRQWTPRHLMLKQKTRSVSVMCLGSVDHEVEPGRPMLEGDIVIGPSHGFFLDQRPYNLHMINRKGIRFIQEGNNRAPLLCFNIHFSSIRYPFMDIAFLTFAREDRADTGPTTTWNIDMPNGACLFHERDLKAADRLWKVYPSMIGEMRLRERQHHEKFRVEMFGGSKSYSGTISELHSEMGESYGCIVVNSDEPGEPFGCLGDSGRPVWCHSQTNSAKFLLGMYVAGTTDDESLKQQALVVPISNVATLLHPHRFIVRHDATTATTSAASSSVAPSSQYWENRPLRAHRRKF